MSFGQRPLVDGHRIKGRVYRFPHRCSGAGCAVEAWLARRDRELLYRLERAEVPDALVEAVERDAAAIEGRAS